MNPQHETLFRCQICHILLANRFGGLISILNRKGDMGPPFAVYVPHLG